MHAAAALAQAVGRAVGYDKTALMFVERDTATLAVVETADGSVVKVLSQSLHSADAIAVLSEMVTSLEAEESVAQGMFVVGSGGRHRGHGTVGTSRRCPSSPLKNPSWRWRAAPRWRRRMRRATTHPPSAWPTHKIPTGPRSTR